MNALEKINLLRKNTDIPQISKTDSKNITPYGSRGVSTLRSTKYNEKREISISNNELNIFKDNL